KFKFSLYGPLSKTLQKWQSDPTHKVSPTEFESSSSKFKQCVTFLLNQGVLAKDSDGNISVAMVSSTATPSVKKGPHWCDFHNANHQASTKCEHLEKQKLKKQKAEEEKK